MASQDSPPAAIDVLECTTARSSFPRSKADNSSDPYNIEGGLREGSVLLPILYTILINDLLEKLQRTGNGVSIAGDPRCYIATLGYATT